MKRHTRGVGRGFGRRELLVEPLESRAMLAGNVLASVDATGMLQITGDSKVNNISISQDASTGAFLLSGVNTTINGLPSVNLSTLAGFTGGANINLRGGNDVIAFTGASASGSFAGDVNVQGGGGNDSVSLSGLNISGAVNIQGGAGNDTVNLSNLTATGNVSISTNGGRDPGLLSKRKSRTANITVQSGAGYDP